MKYKLERDLNRKKNKMASDIRETIKVASCVIVFLIFAMSFGNIYTPIIVACVGVGLGLMYLDHKFKLI